MTETEKELDPTKIAEKFLEALRKNPSIREQFLELIEPGAYVKRDELAEVMQEIKQLRVENVERYEAMDRRFEEVFKRFENMDRRFEATQKQMDERFETMQKQMDRRFEEVFKRFENVDRRFEEVFKRFENVDRRFEEVFQRFDDLSLALGHDFEEFNSYWLQTFLIEQGYPKIDVKKYHFVDNDYSVFPDSKDIELDLFNEKPLVVGEVTAFVRGIDKVNVFLRKVKFIENLFKCTADYKLFITYAIDAEIRDEAVKLLEDNGVILITIRRHPRDR
ncbi:MAG: hypothetical protein K9W43_13765 [Candidatus Thorarchaeota archaeon]|nr:hypothetical protein [Candidatus Thorarchaeota archaeon]